MTGVLHLLVRNYYSGLCKFRVLYPPHGRFYCTSTEKKPLTNPAVFDLLLHKHHFSPAAAAETASVITHLKDPEKTNCLLSFLKENEFSNTHLEKILKYSPSFISADLEKSVKPKIKIFQELRFSNNDIADLLASNPSIFYRSMDNRVIPAIRVLRSVLGSDANVVKLLMKSGWFLVTDLEKCMVPNIEFFKSRSVHMKQIIRCMHSFTRFLLRKPEIVRKRAEQAEKMGVMPISNMYIHAVRVLVSMTDEAWELKLQAFRSFGFSEDDILTAFKKQPPAFAVSVKKMEKVIDTLVSTGKYDIASIINYPISFACSIDRRYKPRLQVLCALERKNLIKKWPNLSGVCTLTDKNFFRRFVGPYIDEVGHLFVSKTGITNGLDQSNL